MKVTSTTTRKSITVEIDPITITVARVKDGVVEEITAQYVVYGVRAHQSEYDGEVGKVYFDYIAKRAGKSKPVGKELSLTQYDFESQVWNGTYYTPTIDPRITAIESEITEMFGA